LRAIPIPNATCKKRTNAIPNAKEKPPEKLSKAAGISFLRLKSEPTKAITNPVNKGLMIKLNP
jgi:hypothetical protein